MPIRGEGIVVLMKKSSGLKCVILYLSAESLRYIYRASDRHVSMYSTIERFAISRHHIDRPNSDRGGSKFGNTGNPLIIQQPITNRSRYCLAMNVDGVLKDKGTCINNIDTK